MDARGLLLLLLLLQIQLGNGEPEGPQVYVVYMGHLPLGFPSAQLSSLHVATLDCVLQSASRAAEALVYSYQNALNGFAALLSPEAAETLSRLPNVVSVFPSRLRQLSTTHSWSFLGMNARDRSGLWGASRYGKKVIIGVLDTGVWPESKSFSSDGMPAPPAKWKGSCMAGDGFNSSTCNRKLVGAKYFLKAFEASLGRASGFRSARDDRGHGSHVCSIATGQSVRKANFNGLAKGIARGGAPHSHLAIYKVCWTSPFGVGCNDADMLAALDAAVADGVDIISISIVQENPQPAYINDAVSIGTFHAIQKGIFVACAAGNSGQQGVATLSNLAPWITTVAASSTDRIFGVDVVLGDGAHFQATLLSSPATVDEWPVQGAPIVYGGDAFSAGAQGFSQSCQFLDPAKIQGKLLLCDFNAADGFPTSTSLQGAVGAIFILSFDLIDVPSQTILYPAVAVEQKIGDAIFEYIRSGRPASAFLSRPSSKLGAAPAPLIAGFSSRGPNSLTPDILKPDLTAPGVQILGAWSPYVNFQTDYGVSETAEYNIQSGTSMSCPHVSGVAALIKSVHPSWSPAAIKSALMTTAYSDGIRDAATMMSATPFAYGSGHLNPSKAANPGLVYDATPADFATFLCSVGYNSTSIRTFTGVAFTCPKARPSPADLNYPSFAISSLIRTRILSRTLTNVGPAASVVYTATVVPPPGVIVQVVPPRLAFSALGQQLGFKLIFQVQAGSGGNYVFGKLTWSDGVHLVRSPIAVVASK